MSSDELRRRVHRFLVPAPKLEPPINPALLKREQERANVLQNRIADRITAFSGSMLFVYVHVIWFACWIGFGVGGLSVRSLDDDRLARGDLPVDVRPDLPEPRRAKRQVIADQQWQTVQEEDTQNVELLDAKRQTIADAQWKTVQEEDAQNVELLDLSRQILALTKEVHSVARNIGAGGGAESLALAGEARDVGRDRVDLRGAQPAAERRHAAAAVGDLPHDDGL